jgi:hypothetical protein
MAGLDSNEREIVSKILESKAIDFQALGAVIGEVASDMIFRLDGEEGICGTMRRFVRVMWLNNPVAQLEQLEELQQVVSELHGGLTR